jgi:hypothetical protein
VASKVIQLLYDKIIGKAMLVIGPSASPVARLDVVIQNHTPTVDRLEFRRKSGHFRGWKTVRLGAGCAEKNAEGVDIGADGSMAARKQLVLTLKNSWLSVLVESVEREPPKAETEIPPRSLFLSSWVRTSIS